MKINAEVLSAETNGDCISMKLQGYRKSDAEWRSWLRFTIEVHDTAQNRKAYHIGRNVQITVEPLP